jgi:hypothetical protein
MFPWKPKNPVDSAAPAIRKTGRKMVDVSSLAIKNLVKTLLAKVGLGIFNVRGRYDQDGLFTIHSDHFRHDPAFRAAYRRGVQ